MYIFWNFLSVIFNYAYILTIGINIPLLPFIRLILNWGIFPAIIVLTNFAKVYSRRIRPMASIFITFFVAAMCYGSSYILYYLKAGLPLDAFGIKAIFLTNFNFFLPFLINFILCFLKMTVFKSKKSKKKRRSAN